MADGRGSGGPVILQSREKHSGHRGPLRAVALVFMLTAVLILAVSLYLRQLSMEMAVSDAIDIITLKINDTVHELMMTGEFEYSDLVTLEKNSDGSIAAITSNMSAINLLSTELLRQLVGKNETAVLEINIPVGNLMGSNLLLGRGPDVPVQIIMLTSSFARFRNELSDAGINQTRHQILLELEVDIDVLIPWDMVTTSVISEVLIAETVIVGKTPETYISWE